MTIEITHDGALSGDENMRRDLSMVERVQSGLIDLSLRTYRWEPWCVSLGMHQASTQIDRSACVQRGLDIVRRPTGGRAVLHADELTYAFALRLSSQHSARAVYQRFHTLLHEALLPFAPELTITTLGPSLREHYAASGPLGQVCFSAHAPSELLWKGRKVVGSAQRIIEGVVLQHGSILCGPGHEELGHVLNAHHDTRIRIVDTMKATSVTLSDISGRSIVPDDAERALGQHLTVERLSSMLFTG